MQKHLACLVGLFLINADVCADVCVLRLLPRERKLHAINFAARQTRERKPRRNFERGR